MLGFLQRYLLFRPTTCAWPRAPTRDTPPPMFPRMVGRKQFTLDIPQGAVLRRAVNRRRYYGKNLSSIQPSLDGERLTARIAC
jgi:hypothetical protein